jgi:hypothetical protein
MDIKKKIDLYQKKKEEKGHFLSEILSGKRQFMVMQKPESEIWGRCNNVNEVVNNNLKYFERQLLFPYSDDVPYLEPWIGTGVYANAFGCETLWREDNAPDTHYRYHSIEKVANLPYPDWKKSQMMQMTLDIIRKMKDETMGQLPIALTDTQSPYDTATLILDSCKFFTGCYTHPEIVQNFMQKITDLTIEFSKIQQEEIGDCLARPGHIFPSLPGVNGIAISDDNLAVSSPDVNEMVSFPANKQISDAFNGIAIHSCGNWSHTMTKLQEKSGKVMMIDCAVDLACDPNPNDPKTVGEALAGSDIIAKIRMGSDMEKNKKIVRQVFQPGLKLVSCQA